MKYYLPAFLEGFTVMALELIIGHVLYIFFGSSLITWTSVIGFTVGGLAIGYFISGKYSFPGNYKSLAYLFSAISLLLFLFPFSTEKILFSVPVRNIQFAILFCSFLLIIPFTILLGTIPPALIRMSVQTLNNSGNKSGQVFAISTLGGLCSCFLFGFFLMPFVGIRFNMLILGILSALFAFSILWKDKKKTVILLSIVCSLFIAFGFFNKPAKNVYKVLHNSEGILGQLMVLDDFSNLNENMPGVRILFINRTPQTVFFPQNKGNQYSEYVLGVSAMASIYPAGSKALVLGAGGGAVVDHFHKLGFHTDVCDLDKRMVDIGKNYFNLKNIPVNYFIDDARHYINVCRKKYDVIVFDIFNGENTPSHVLTKESIEQACNLLNDGGMILVNFNGFLQSKQGISTRSLIKTFKALGLNVNVLPTPGEESTRNCILQASFNNPDFSKVRLDSLTNNKNFDLQKLIISYRKDDLPDAFILNDNNPILERINLEANFQWRTNGITNSLKKLYKKGVPLFY